MFFEIKEHDFSLANLLKNENFDEKTFRQNMVGKNSGKNVKGVNIRWAKKLTKLISENYAAGKTI
jgi:hypothetical protein